MGKLNVKNGTPIGGTHLCRTCDWGQFMTGYRESDLLVMCTNTNPNIVVPFTMYECSEYQDKHKPDWKQMQSLAINIAPVRVSTRTAGFSTVAPLRPAASESAADADNEDAAEEVALER